MGELDRLQIVTQLAERWMTRRRTGPPETPPVPKKLAVNG